jgi:hypothetical protein
VDGIAAETALAALQAIDAMPTYFYGRDPRLGMVDADHLAVAAYVEAASRRTSTA